MKFKQNIEKKFKDFAHEDLKESYLVEGVFGDLLLHLQVHLQKLA
jgi:hypothetical protein